MKILLDQSPKLIREKSEKFGAELWQLRTPLTRYALSGKPYGLDNGCFSEFRKTEWERLVDEAEENRPLFVCLPDIVGDATRTLDLFDQFKRFTNGLPRALVLQDGIGRHRIPWGELDAVFVGGSDNFKTAPEAINACKAAKMLGKWVHVGRVNTPRRVASFVGLADSIDGSGISRYDHMLESVLNEINGEKRQLDIVWSQ